LLRGAIDGNGGQDALSYSPGASSYRQKAYVNLSNLAITEHPFGDTPFAALAPRSATAIHGNGQDGLASIEIVVGGTEDDQLFGFTTGNKLVGALGDDLVVGGDNADILIGGGKGDASYLDNLRSFAPNTIGPAEAQSLGQTASGIRANQISDDDTLVGMGGNDVLIGGRGADILRGDGGNDWLFGGADSDTYVFANDWGQDKILDESGTLDTLDFRQVTH
jgi:Ca2+-binding RTX toxin-like protein